MFAGVNAATKALATILPLPLGSPKGMRKKDALQPDRTLVSYVSQRRSYGSESSLWAWSFKACMYPSIFHKSRILDFQISRADFKIMDKVQYMQAAITLLIPIFVFQQWVSQIFQLLCLSRVSNFNMKSSYTHTSCMIIIKVLVFEFRRMRVG